MRLHDNHSEMLVVFCLNNGKFTNFYGFCFFIRRCLGYLPYAYGDKVQFFDEVL